MIAITGGRGRIFDSSPCVLSLAAASLASTSPGFRTITPKRVATFAAVEKSTMSFMLSIMLLRINSLMTSVGERRVTSASSDTRICGGRSIGPSKRDLTGCRWTSLPLSVDSRRGPRDLVDLALLFVLAILAPKSVITVASGHSPDRASDSLSPNSARNSSVTSASRRNALFILIRNPRSPTWSPTVQTYDPRPGKRPLRSIAAVPS